MFALFYFTAAGIVFVYMVLSLNGNEATVEITDRIGILIAYFAAVSSLYISILGYKNSKKRVSFRVVIDSMGSEAVVTLIVNNQLADTVVVTRVAMPFFIAKEFNEHSVCANDCKEIEFRLDLKHSSMVKKIIKAKKSLACNVAYRTTDFSESVSFSEANPFYTPMWPKIARRDVLGKIRGWFNEEG